MPRLHPRYFIVTKAESAICAKVWEMATNADLTTIEVAGILSRATSDALKYALREERHPADDGRKADEA